MSKRGLLVPSAGRGLGIERLVRFLTKRKHIKEVTLFPKVPREKIDF
jgi:asparaginyl-tRNA synthetase